MGRKEYFETLEDLRLLRNSITSKSKSDECFASSSREEMLSDIDARIERLHFLVEKGA